MYFINYRTEVYDNGQWDSSGLQMCWFVPHRIIFLIRNFYRKYGFLASFKKSHLATIQWLGIAAAALHRICFHQVPPGLQILLSYWDITHLCYRPGPFRHLSLGSLRFLQDKSVRHVWGDHQVLIGKVQERRHLSTLKMWAGRLTAHHTQIISRNNFPELPGLPIWCYYTQ